MTATFNYITELISQHIQMYHVSLGGSFADPEILLPAPDGSGTFIKFKTDAGLIYGILTAAHVARCLKFGRSNKGTFIGLSKFQDGDNVACSITFPFIYHLAPYDRFHMQSKEGYRPDIAFIALGLDHFPQHDLLKKSQFYDLDANIEFGFVEDPQIVSAFFRGACHDWEIENGYMNTPLCIGGRERIKNAEYWEIPNTSGKSIGGASGAGFWRFRYENGTLQKSLEGVVIGEGKNHDYIEAMATPCLYDDFLPALKRFCIENLSWFI